MKVASLIAVSLALCGSIADCQTYLLSTPVTGYLEVDMTNWADFPQWTHGAGSIVSVSTLNDMLYYDPTSNTLRQVGTVGLISTQVNLAFADNQLVGGSNWVPASVSANLNLGSASFDTGYQEMLGAGGFVLSFPVTGSYEVDTGGQTYSGPLSYSLGMDIHFNTSLTSTSLTYESVSLGGAHGGPSMASVTASNGFVAAFIGGANDKTYYYHYAVGPVTVEAIPEPTALGLVLMGLVGLGMLCRRRQPF